MAQFIDDSSSCQVGKILYFSHTASYPLLDLTNHAPLDITAGFSILYVMKLICLLWVFAFAEPVDCEAQAATLLDMGEANQTPLYTTRPRITLDESDFIWIVGDWKVQDQYRSQVHATRIQPNGKIELDMISVNDNQMQEAGYNLIGYSNVCDRWGNLYLGFATEHKYKATSLSIFSTVHLIRVSPQGEVQDYHPWPQMEHYQNFIEIHGDTLILLGIDSEANLPRYQRPCRISKALIDINGLTPFFEKKYFSDNYPSSLLWSPSDHNRIFFDWNRGIAFSANIVSNPEDRSLEKLGILRLNLLSSETSITQDSVGTYKWRDFVWRTYKDTWIGWMTFTNHENGGYLLCLPDPKNRSLTHVLRLDSNGEPIAPSALDKGGLKSSSNFDRRPSSVEPLVDFMIWKTQGYKTNIKDSAHVLFWGCDDEGNLYAYRQFRRYPSEHPEN